MPFQPRSTTPRGPPVPPRAAPALKKPPPPPQKEIAAAAPARAATGIITTETDDGTELPMRLNNRVFIDGRNQLYGESLFHRYNNMVASKDAWARDAERYGINTALVDYSIPGADRFVARLYADRRWRLVFFDEKDPRSSFFELPILALDLDEPGLLKS